MERESFELHDAAGVIRGEVLHPVRARASAIVCHGFKGFYRWGFFPFLAESLAAAGVRTVVFNFSGSGVGADLESFTEADSFYANTFTRELRDLAAVEEEATRRGWLDDRYGLFGHSRGGGVAILYTAASPRVGALVTWSAIGTVERWIPEEAVRWRERGYTEVTNSRTGQVLRLGTALLDDVETGRAGALDIAAAAERVRIPWLIVHGAADETVPVAEGQHLHERAAGRSELLVLEGVNHAFDIKHPVSAPSPALSAATERTVDFMLHHLA